LGFENLKKMEPTSNSDTFTTDTTSATQPAITAAPVEQNATDEPSEVRNLTSVVNTQIEENITPEARAVPTPATLSHTSGVQTQAPAVPSGTHTTSITNTRVSSLHRLSQEYEELKKDPPEGFTAGPVSDSNMYLWNLVLTGPPDTPYEDGVFKAKIKVNFKLHKIGLCIRFCIVSR